MHASPDLLRHGVRTILDGHAATVNDPLLAQMGTKSEGETRVILRKLGIFAVLFYVVYYLASGLGLCSNGFAQLHGLARGCRAAKWARARTGGS